MSIGGNANYTHIQSHGTPSPFEPGFIAQAGVAGPYGQPVVPLSTIVDVNVDLVDAIAADGDAILNTVHK